MINVTDIERESVVDGDGIRYTIFEQGCTHNCPGCQNPETHEFVNKTLMEVDDILEDIGKNPLIDGITLSGGDPFFQAKENISLIEGVHEMGGTIWAYTGYSWEDFFNYKINKKQPLDKSEINDDMIKMLEKCDVIVDGRFKIKLKSLDHCFIGSTNQRIIDVKKSLWKEIPETLDFDAQAL